MLPPPNPPGPSRTPSQSLTRTARPSTSRIGTDPYGYGEPVFVRDGMFADKWMSCVVPQQVGMTDGFRFGLEVAQQPVHGRRKTDKDRRPIAHAPIVRFHARERRLTRSGDWEEHETDIACVLRRRIVECGMLIRSALESSSLICAAELDVSFEPKEGEGGPGPSSMRSREGTESPVTSGSVPRLTSRSSGSAMEEDGGGSGSRKGSRGSGAITQQRNLYGGLHVAGVRVPTMNGGMGVWFLFTVRF